MSPCSRNAGFSVVEILVSIVIVALLVCVAVPAVETIQDDDRITDVLMLIEHYEDAVRSHHADTGRSAIERSDRETKWIMAHHLTEPQSYAGWAGPYLNLDDLAANSLFDGDVLLYDNLAGGMARPYASSFKIGQGIQERRYQGSGQFLALTHVSEESALEIDAAIDKDEVGNWRRRGRVQWRAANHGTLMVLLLSD